MGTQEVFTTEWTSFCSCPGRWKPLEQVLGMAMELGQRHSPCGTSGPVPGPLHIPTALSALQLGSPITQHFPILEGPQIH